MKTKLLLLAGLATGFALQLCPPALANPLTASGTASPGEIIPDDNLSGIISTITLNSVAAQNITIIDGVSVTLDITGDPTAYNGDYYAYLQNSSGLVVLLNSIDSGSPYSLPYGSSGNGINVTFTDGNPSIGSAPYAVNTPLGPGTYSAQQGVNALDSTFGGYASPVGGWTLFVADTSPGGVGELASWSLTVVGTPDNGGTLLLLTMGVGLLGLYSMLQAPTRPISRD